MKLRRLLIGLAVLQMILAYVWAIEPNWIEVTRQETRLANLPAEFDGVTLALLSDLHIKTFSVRERHMLQLLAETKPDLIAIVGDFTLEGSDPAAIRKVLEGLRDNRPRLGIKAVLGNHDHWHPLATDHAAVRSIFERASITLLVNEAETIGEGLQAIDLLGIDDPFTGHANLTAALRTRQRMPISILLSHSPEIFPEADQARVDVVLAGHTHGGQVRLPFIGPLWLPAGSEPYLSGWFEGHHARMFVTRGIGTAILPFRFLCRPELSLITLKRNEQ